MVACWQEAGSPQRRGGEGKGAGSRAGPELEEGSVWPVLERVRLDLPGHLLFLSPLPLPQVRPLRRFVSGTVCSAVQACEHCICVEKQGCRMLRPDAAALHTVSLRASRGRWAGSLFLTCFPHLAEIWSE